MRVITVLLTLLLTACSVHDYEVKKAEAACKDYGGWRELDRSLGLYVRCHDGNWFRLR